MCVVSSAATVVAVGPGAPRSPAARSIVPPVASAATGSWPHIAFSVDYRGGQRSNPTSADWGEGRGFGFFGDATTCVRACREKVCPDTTDRPTDRPSRAAENFFVPTESRPTEILPSHTHATATKCVERFLVSLARAPCRRKIHRRCRRPTSRRRDDATTRRITAGSNVNPSDGRRSEDTPRSARRRGATRDRVVRATRQTRAAH